MTAPLLILDLDETLIFGTRTPLFHPPDLEHGGWCIYHRPHLAEFIAQVRTAYELAVWTAATGSYADLVVGTAFPPDLPFAFVWSRERCTWRHHPETREEYWLKNLRKVERLGYDLDRVLMVDDEAHKLERNYGNPIERSRVRAVSPFTRLARYLLSVSTRPICARSRNAAGGAARTCRLPEGQAALAPKRIGR